jgi:hypothetical protein
VDPELDGDVLACIRDDQRRVDRQGDRDLPRDGPGRGVAGYPDEQ